MDPRFSGGWTPHRPARYGVDYDTAACAFASNNCTASMIGAGGLDEHHEWPVSLGGNEAAASNILLLLCPNHHRRQHALIRYLVERIEAGMSAEYAVLRHFTVAERTAANYAVTQWLDAGEPTINGWPAPAARDA